MLRISFDNISKSIKFAAFITSGLLVVIAWLQLVLTDSLFWTIVAYASGLIFVSMLLAFLLKILKPAFVAFNKWKNKRSGKGKSTFVRIIKYLFEKKTYQKIMAIIWFIILMVALDLAFVFLGLIEDKQQKYLIWANFSFMLLTISAALFISYISRLFKKK